MIEPIMFIGIGFLVAGLLVIGAIPMVHARAVRLTQRRLEAMTPMSMAEIHADKDQLRAEFAMSTRRLEMSVDQMKAKTSSQLAEIGKKSEAVGRLKLELGEKAAALLGAEAKVNSLTEEIAERPERARRQDRTPCRRPSASSPRRRPSSPGSPPSSTTAPMQADSQRVELVTLQAQAEMLKGQIEGNEQEIKSLQGRLEAQTANLETANRQLGEERIKTETHGGPHQGDREAGAWCRPPKPRSSAGACRSCWRGSTSTSGWRVERETSAEQYRNQLAAAARTEADIRAELAERENSHRIAAEALSAEKASAEEQLKLAHQERDQLRRDVAAMKQEAETAWATERMETAVMRERINDVAAEVARLTATLEGPNSPIEAILAGESGLAHARQQRHGQRKGQWRA